MWNINRIAKTIKLNNPVLIEGLPGIGNVGKVAVDFMIDDLEAKKLCEFESHAYPHSVYVNEKNIIELPIIEMYYKQRKSKNDLLFLSGDVQPIDEISCYQFSEKVLELFQTHKGKEIITIGGIAQKEIPKNPKIYCTGNSQRLINNYTRGMRINKNLYGAIGPITGVSGLLLGLAKKRRIPAITLLAETHAHPLYLGVNGAKEIIRILNKKLGLRVQTRSLDKEIHEIEQELQEFGENIKPTSLKKLKTKTKEVNYIG